MKRAYCTIGCKLPEGWVCVDMATGDGYLEALSISDVTVDTLIEYLESNRINVVVVATLSNAMLDPYANMYGTINAIAGRNIFVTPDMLQ